MVNGPNESFFLPFLAMMSNDPTCALLTLSRKEKKTLNIFPFPFAGSTLGVTVMLRMVEIRASLNFTILAVSITLFLILKRKMILEQVLLTASQPFVLAT